MNFFLLCLIMLWYTLNVILMIFLASDIYPIQIMHSLTI